MAPQHPEQLALAIEGNWQVSPAIDPGLLERLYEINLMYLDFLARDPPCHAEVRAEVESSRYAAAQNRLAQELEGLALDSRLILARCPFSLFTARFHDGRFWGAQLRPSAVRDSAPAFVRSRRADSAATAFADLALFYAWHVVQANPLAARVLLGMVEPTQAAFRQLPLLHIQQLAREHPDLVMPRWVERLPFWRGLLSLAHRGIEERLIDMRSLGIQMIAAELAANDSVT